MNEAKTKELTRRRGDAEKAKRENNDKRIREVKES